MSSLSDPTAAELETIENVDIPVLLKTEANVVSSVQNEAITILTNYTPADIRARNRRIGKAVCQRISSQYGLDCYVWQARKSREDWNLHDVRIYLNVAHNTAIEFNIKTDLNTQGSIIEFIIGNKKRIINDNIDNESENVLIDKILTTIEPTVAKLKQILDVKKDSLR